MQDMIDKKVKRIKSFNEYMPEGTTGIVIGVLERANLIKVKLENGEIIGCDVDNMAIVEEEKVIIEDNQENIAYATVRIGASNQTVINTIIQKLRDAKIDVEIL